MLIINYFIPSSLENAYDDMESMKCCVNNNYYYNAWYLLAGNFPTNAGFECLSNKPLL